MAQHICSPCGKKFTSEAKYLAHECEKTGYKPTEFTHWNTLTKGQAAHISAAAMTRGEKIK